MLRIERLRANNLSTKPVEQKVSPVFLFNSFMKAYLAVIFMTVMLSFQCTAQTADVGFAVDSVIKNQFNLWSHEVDNNQAMLKYKHQSYRNIDVKRDVNKIYELLHSLGNELNIMCFYNPLEFISYTYVLRTNARGETDVFEYYPTEPNIVHIGTTTSTTALDVVDRLCLRENQRITDSFFYKVHISKHREISVQIPVGFSMQTDLQIMYLVLMANLN